MSDTDVDGNRLLTAGIWRSDSTPNLEVQGGQGMHFVVTNTGVLGVSVSVTANDGEEQSSTIAALGVGDLRFSNFGPEPHTWRFNPSIESEGSVVSWRLHSTWIPGDPPNG
jgi:hypothetical protein